MSYSFSGHETFSCKQYWLKKGLDYLVNNKSFSNDNAVVGLGVGKNMVTAIRFWLKAFGMITDNDETTPLAEFIFGEDGVDPYLEDEGTLWLLHYQLIKMKKSSIYDLVFNHIRYERPEFTREQLEKSLNIKIEEAGLSFSPNTIANDVKVFLNNYVTTRNTDVEDNFAGILHELNLLTKYQATNHWDKKSDWFKFQVSDKVEVPSAIILFTILDNDAYGSSVSFRDLMYQPDSPGNVFLISENGLRDKMKEMTDHYQVTFNETAGNQVLQLKSEIDRWKVLKTYYRKNE